MKTRGEIERLLKKRGFWLEGASKHVRWTNGDITFSVSHNKQPPHATLSLLSALRRMEKRKPLTPRSFDKGRIKIT